ncbi:pentapeptide repeat-containing protein [Streptacidiphilus sp. ASG 303]|uniref:pentapeptide repeat-containing protein n=1 Tax=Streptacidiphilus sp. ASG 303 TaxID=2896847 RepID=UPI001E3FBBCE|nr:pentapeptide repeat-containing protein [Streptacidiphilus sp. ASG 303]MCD0482452.1 pentapeptide repeat-containing protein [Streptacidiphilus sp. ASG 303]
MATALPRDRADLPYAAHLEPADGPLSREGDYDTVLFEDVEFDGPEAGGARFTECAFASVSFNGGRMRRARFNDVWLHTVRWVGTDLAQSGWLDAEVVAGMLAGLEVYDAELRRVSFHHCKFDSVNLRGAVLRDVVFHDCVLRDVDFAGASLTGAAFPGSVLEGVRFDRARLSRVDLRGAAALGIAGGLDGLRGATVSSAQLVELAPLLADTLGIAVRDR